MPLFSREKSRRNKQERKIMNSDPVPIQRSNTQSYKEHSYDVHDPVLTAVHDPQPFEESMGQTHYRTVSSSEGKFRDVFGNVIAVPDKSNPTRQRNERPLDTIRAFEYACTGDERIRDEMETPRLGWGTRQGFNSMPQFDSNPYQQQSTSTPQVLGYDQGQSYNRPQEPPAPAPKKKRGLFGRKKK